jgi:pimeloyl-ACP methyl ester carboxylesterase
VTAVVRFGIEETMQMTRLIKTLAAAAAGAALATGALAQSGIEHHVTRIDGTRFHYVTAGNGDPVLLLPGWPESWIAWRKVVPLLVAAGRSVVVLDPRGFGESDKPAGGYDLDTASRDLHRFLEATGLTRPGGIDVIAHDVGTWIAHAHAVDFPADVKRLVLTESNIPGVTAFPGGIPSEAINLKAWQFAFNRLNDLPEMLIQGREREYLAWIFSTKSTRSYAIDPAALDEYTRQYSAPGAMRAGFCLVSGKLQRRRPGAGEGARSQAIGHAGSRARRVRRRRRRASRHRRDARRSSAGRAHHRPAGDWPRKRRHRLRPLPAGGMPGRAHRGRPQILAVGLAVSRARSIRQNVGRTARRTRRCEQWTVRNFAGCANLPLAVEPHHWN